MTKENTAEIVLSGQLGCTPTFPGNVDKAFSNLDSLIDHLAYPKPRKILSVAHTIQKANNLLVNIEAKEGSRFFSKQQYQALKSTIDSLQKGKQIEIQETVKSIKEILKIIKKSGGLEDVQDDFTNTDYESLWSVTDRIEEELSKQPGKYPLVLEDENIVLDALNRITQTNYDRLVVGIILFDKKLCKNETIKTEFILAARKFRYDEQKPISDLIDATLNIGSAMINPPNLFANQENLNRAANFAINMLLMICELRKERPDNLQEFTPSEEQKNRIANLFAVVLCNKIDNPEYKKIAKSIYAIGRLLFPEALEDIIKNNPNIAHFDIEQFKQLTTFSHPLKLAELGTDYPFSLGTKIDFADQPALIATLESKIVDQDPQQIQQSQTSSFSDEEYSEDKIDLTKLDEDALQVLEILLNKEAKENAHYIAFNQILNLANQHQKLDHKKQYIQFLINRVTHDYFIYLQASCNRESEDQEWCKNFMKEARPRYQDLFGLLFKSFPQEMANVMDFIINIATLNDNEIAPIQDHKRFGIIALFDGLQRALKECPEDTKNQFIDNLRIYYKSPTQEPESFGLSHQDFEKILVGKFYLKSKLLSKNAAIYLKRTLKLAENHQSRIALESFIGGSKDNAQIIADFISQFDFISDTKEIITLLKPIKLPEGVELKDLFDEFLLPEPSETTSDIEEELTPEQQIEYLRSRISELEKQLQAQFEKEVAADNADLDPENQVLKKRVAELESELGKAKASIKFLEKQQSTTASQNEAKQREREDLITRLKKQIKDLERIKGNLGKQVEDSSKERSVLDEELQQINQTLSKIKSSKEALELKLKTATSSTQSTAEQIKEIENLKTRLQDIEQEQKDLQDRKTRADGKSIELFERLLGLKSYVDILRQTSEERLLDNQTLLDRVNYINAAINHSFNFASSALFSGVATNQKIYYGSKVYYYALGAANQILKGNPDQKDFDIKIAVDDPQAALDQIIENAQKTGYAIIKEAHQFTEPDGTKGFNIKLKYPGNPGPIDITISQGKQISSPSFQFYGQRLFINADTGAMGIFGSDQHPPIDTWQFLQQVNQDPNFIYQVNYETNKLFETLFLKDNFSGLPPQMFSQKKFRQRIAEEFKEGYYAQVQQDDDFEAFVTKHFIELTENGEPKDQRYEQLRGLFLGLKNEQMKEAQAKATLEASEKAAQLEQKMRTTESERERRILEERAKMEQELPATETSLPVPVQENPWQAGARLPKSVTEKGLAKEARQLPKTNDTPQPQSSPFPTSSKPMDQRGKTNPHEKQSPSPQITILKRPGASSSSPGR